MFARIRKYANSSAYLRDLKDAVLHRAPAGHFQTIFPDDVFLVSYLRSGQTWTRFLIANLKDSANPATFADIELRVPSNHAHPDQIFQRLPRPRVISTHKSFYPYYPSVIYLVRDPRDVAISRYYHELKMGLFDDDLSMEEFVRRFVSGQVDEYRKSGGWGDHVLSWLAMRAGQPRFLLVRYEELKRETRGQLARLASFLKLEADQTSLARAIELSSLARMRELDERQPLGWLRGTRRDVPFVRKGVAGGWRSNLSETCIRAIESAWGPLMKLLGYDLVSSPAPTRNGAQVNAITCEILSSARNSCLETPRGADGASCGDVLYAQAGTDSLAGRADRKCIGEGGRVDSE